MRISDWSSDVCSSDLLSRDGVVRLLGDGFEVRVLHDLSDLGLHGVHGKTPFGPTLGLMSTTLHPTALCDKGHAGALYARLTDSAKIGRASGRERGCQYV